MKNRPFKLLLLFITTVLISYSCSKNTEEVTLQKVHYESMANNCEDALKWIGVSNPNFREYTLIANADILTFNPNNSIFGSNIKAISDQGKVVKTDFSPYDVARDHTNGKLYERVKRNIYAIDRESFTKTSLAQSELINSVGSTIIDNDMLYTSEINRENKTIEIVRFDLQTLESSVIHQETNPEDGYYLNHLFFGSKNDKKYLIFRSENENSSYAHAYSLNEKSVVWRKDIGKTRNTSRWVRGGQFLVDATFDYVKSYDMETGNLIIEKPTDGIFFEATGGNHAIVSKEDYILVINLNSGQTQEIEGQFVHLHNSILYAISDKNEFGAFNLKTNKNQFCLDLNEFEETKDMTTWKGTGEGRFIAGTIAHCDATEVIVLKY